MTKHVERTYEVEMNGAPFGPLTKEQRGGLTRRLRGDAGGETLGATEVVSMSGLIGGTMKVTVRAPVVEQAKPPKEPALPALNAPAKD